MENIDSPGSLLLRWSKHLPASDVQDPLGLSLRGGARLGASLLYCITSISPRARYFSFIPWCIHDFRTNELGKTYAKGLEEALILREHALALGCVAHHQGKPCSGGNLVGSDKAIAWFSKHPHDVADFRTLRFVQIPAYRAYFNALVNLGVFVTDDENPRDEEGPVLTASFNDIALSPLGRTLAESYDASVNGLLALKQIRSADRLCSLPALEEMGKKGGLCEIAEPSAPDRQLLRDVLFCRTGLADGSHQFRRQSLLLILELCRQLTPQEVAFNEEAFCRAVYYGTIESAGSAVPVRIPTSLNDITARWRMFYFHYYVSVALESLFSWTVNEVGSSGLSGRTTRQPCCEGSTRGFVREGISKLFGKELHSTFALETPASFMSSFGINGEKTQ